MAVHLAGGNATEKEMDLQLEAGNVKEIQRCLDNSHNTV